MPSLLGIALIRWVSRCVGGLGVSGLLSMACVAFIICCVVCDFACCGYFLGLPFVTGVSAVTAGSAVFFICICVHIGVFAFSGSCVGLVGLYLGLILVCCFMVGCPWVCAWCCAGL